MAFRDALHGLTLAASAALLGVCIPLLIWIPSSLVNRRVELIVVTSLLTAFTAATVLFSLRSLLPAVAGKRLALGAKTNASLVVILLVVGAGFMGGLSSWADDLSFLRWYGGYEFVNDEQFGRVEALFNGTTKPPTWGPGPAPPEWRRWELTNIFMQWQWHGTQTRDGNISVRILGIAALVVGWILVVFLVAQLVAVVIPSNRSLWFERIDGGITLRWKDRGIALPEDERESEQPASSSA